MAAFDIPYTCISTCICTYYGIHNHWFRVQYEAKVVSMHARYKCVRFTL